MSGDEPGIGEGSRPGGDESPIGTGGSPRGRGALSLLEDVGEAVGDAVLRRVARASARLQERRDLGVDLFETDDAFLAVFDAPGASPEDVQVRYVGDEIRVRIERFRELHEGFEMRFPGRGLSLSGSIELPADAVVDADDADATLTERGTLEVRVPREPAAESA